MAKKVDPIKQAFTTLKLPAPDSHKGQNGKLLIIGGSKLFHAASKWSLDVASKIVDMVFYSSVPSNNRLVAKFLNNQFDGTLEEQAKNNFWQGIVVSRKKLKPYLEEADCILIGPGMERSHYTARLSNRLLKQYPDKKWVIDAGALQMIKPTLLNANCIITPHQQEMALLNDKNPNFNPDNYTAQATCLLKGQSDLIFSHGQKIEIKGGNAGMTKGGTGDVLAGLVAALYCQNDAQTSAIAASQVNKLAGDKLYKTVGPYFNASDLVAMIPEILWQQRKQ